MNIRAGKKYSNDLYLQDSVGVDKDGNEVTLADRVADESDGVDEQVEDKLKIKALYKKMKKLLKKRECTVIGLRYGIVTGEEVTQREVAKLLGISRSYVSRIEKKALKKLKDNFDEDM